MYTVLDIHYLFISIQPKDNRPIRRTNCLPRTTPPHPTEATPFTFSAKRCDCFVVSSVGLSCFCTTFAAAKNSCEEHHAV